MIDPTNQFDVVQVEKQAYKPLNFKDLLMDDHMFYSLQTQYDANDGRDINCGIGLPPDATSGSAVQWMYNYTDGIHINESNTNINVSDYLDLCCKITGPIYVPTDRYISKDAVEHMINTTSTESIHSVLYSHYKLQVPYTVFIWRLSETIPGVEKTGKNNPNLFFRGRIVGFSILSRNWPTTTPWFILNLGYNDFNKLAIQELIMHTHGPVKQPTGIDIAADLLDLL